MAQASTLRNSLSPQLFSAAHEHPSQLLSALYSEPHEFERYLAVPQSEEQSPLFVFAGLLAVLPCAQCPSVGPRVIEGFGEVDLPPGRLLDIFGADE